MVRNVSQLLEILALLYCFSAVYARKLKCSIYMVFVYYCRNGVNDGN